MGIDAEAIIAECDPLECSGGERGIRYVTASMPSATYRFSVAAPTVDANIAMAPCPILPDRN